MAKQNPNIQFEQLKHASAQARLPFDAEAWLNLAFYLDQQYVEWNDASRSIREIPRVPDRKKAQPRPTFNKIMHFVQQERALVLQAKPSVDVMPANDDHVAVIETEVAKAYCEWVSHPSNCNFDKQLSRATLWAIVCSEGFLKWVWNPREERPDIIPCSPFELFSDPYARDFAKSRYVIHSQFMDPEQVYELYGRELPASSTESVDPMKSELLQGMGTAPVVNGVTVNEIWHKPSRRYPDGLYAVWSGTEQLVAPQKHPYDHKRIPFTQVGCIERPDSKHYMSPVRFLRSPQMYFNRMMALMLLNRDNFANFKWWVPDELQMDVDPDNSPAQVLRGHGTAGGLKPEIIAPPNLSDNGMTDTIEAQMMHLVGLHEVSQAQVPGRVEAAKAIEILKESDADRQATTLDTIKTSISEGFYQVTMLAKQYMPAGKMVPVFSEDGLPEVKHFKAAKLDPGITINVTMGTGLARSRAARQDQLLNLWQQGVITDQRKLATMLEISHPGFAQPGAADTRLARSENLEMSQGVAIQANSWDDHERHIDEHNEWRKSTAYRSAPKKVRELFEFHVSQHDQLWMEKLNEDARRLQVQTGIAQMQQQAQQQQQMAQAASNGGTAAPPVSQQGNTSGDVATTAASDGMVSA